MTDRPESTRVLDLPPSALARQRELNREARMALPAVRAAAGSWAAASTALFGAAAIAALLAGPDRFSDLPDFWRLVGALLFVFGCACGLLGGLIATWAAQTRFRHTFLSPRSKENFDDDALARALGQMQDARVLTVLGVAGVIGAAAVLWLAKPSDLIQADARSGQLVCGYVTNQGTTPVLRTAQGDFPIAGLRHLTKADECPEQ